MNALIGLGEMHIFKFFVEADGDDRGWPVMRYKVPFSFDAADMVCCCLMSCGRSGLEERLHVPAESAVVF
jgi:hypothetical protein